MAVNEALGRKEGMAIQYANLGALAGQRGAMPGACELWTRTLALFPEVGTRPQVETVEGWIRDAGCKG